MKKITKLVIFSIIILVSSVVLTYYNIPIISNYISIFASVIQIALFVWWLIEDKTEEKLGGIELKTIEIKSGVEEIKKYQEIESKGDKRSQQIIKNLFDNAMIPEDSIIEIINKFRPNEVFLVTNCGGKIIKTLSPNGKEFYPTIDVLTSIGFVNVFIDKKLFIIFKEDLPPQLRNLENLKALINVEVKKVWENLHELALEKFPAGKYKKYEKWRSGTGLKYNLIFVDVVDGRIDPIYKQLKSGIDNQSAFSPEFKSLILKKKLQARNTKDVQFELKKFVAKVSLKYIIENLPEEIRSKIETNESLIRKNLKINGFLYLARTNQKDLENELAKYIDSAEVAETAEKLKKQSQEYLNKLQEFGVRID